MPVGQECYNEHTLTAEENAATLMALRSAFCLPVMLAFFLAVFDLYHVYTQTNWSCIRDAGAHASLVGFALLRAINSYFPSTLLPYAMVVVLQQGIYRVSAGVVSWTLDGLMFWSAVYFALYAVYIVQGGTEPVLSVAMTVATVVFGLSIWLSLDKKVRRASAAWNRLAGKV